MSRKMLANLVFLLMALLMFTAAGSGPLVSVTAGQPEYTSVGLKVPVEVQFSDMSLYNNEVALSAHVYSDDGEILVWETTRYLLELDDSGHTSQIVEINLSDYAELSAVSNGILRFDLVDQKNAFWFSDKEEIFSVSQIEWDKAQIIPDNSVDNHTSDEIVSRMGLIFGVTICVLGWIVVLFGLGYWYYCKKKKGAG